MQKVVARSAEHWLRSRRVVSALAPADSFYSVGAADAITATSGIDLTAQTIAPFANTAQITVDEPSSVGALDGFVEFLFSPAEMTDRLRLRWIDEAAMHGAERVHEGDSEPA